MKRKYCDSFISHRLNEILEVCENYTVMRNGKMIDTTPVTGETTTKEIVEKMLGRKFEENFPKGSLPDWRRCCFRQNTYPVQAAR